MEKLLRVLITGGGTQWLDFMRRPGASKIIDSVIIPYSAEASEQFLGYKPQSFCSIETTVSYYQQLSKGSDKCEPLVVNCSLATDRIKRGTDRVFVAFRGQMHSITLKRNTRENQEWLVATFIDAIVNDKGEVFKDPFIGGFVESYTCNSIQ